MSPRRTFLLVAAAVTLEDLAEGTTFLGGRLGAFDLSLDFFSFFSFFSFAIVSVCEADLSADRATLDAKPFLGQKHHAEFYRLSSPKHARKGVMASNGMCSKVRAVLSQLKLHWN